MKARYLLFSYQMYEEYGGWRDVQRAFDSLEDAKSFQIMPNMDHKEIVDLETGKIVWAADRISRSNWKDQTEFYTK